MHLLSWGSFNYLFSFIQKLKLLKGDSNEAKETPEEKVAENKTEEYISR